MKARSGIQIGGFFVALLLLAAGAQGAWMLESCDLYQQAYTFSLLGPGAFAVLASLILILFFRKTPNPEAFFFIIAVQALAFQSLRPLIAASIEKGYTFLLPSYLTKLVYFGRFLTSLSLFVSGLFASGMTLQRRAIMLSTIFFVSFILAAVMPVDISSFSQRMLYSVGAETSILLGTIILALLSVANYIIAALHQDNRKNYIIALGLLLFITGTGLLVYALHPGIIAAALCSLSLGAYLFGSRTHRIYLWL